jgi:hypothetical protein
MVSGGRKGAGEEPALPFGKSFLSFLFRFCFPPFRPWMDGAAALLLFECCFHRCAVSPCGFRLTPPGVVGNVLSMVFSFCFVVSVVTECFRAEASETVSLYIPDVYE